MPAALLSRPKHCNPISRPYPRLSLRHYLISSSRRLRSPRLHTYLMHPSPLHQARSLLPGSQRARTLPCSRRIISTRPLSPSSRLRRRSSRSSSRTQQDNSPRPSRPPLSRPSSSARHLGGRAAPAPHALPPCARSSSPYLFYCVARSSSTVYRHEPFSFSFQRNFLSLFIHATLLFTSFRSLRAL